MRSYNHISDNSHSLIVNESYEAEPLEIKIEKVTQNAEPIDSTAPTIYTNRADGVQAGYNIRTDRWDVALDAMDKVSASHLAKRKEYLNKKDISTESHTSDNA